VRERERERVSIHNVCDDWEINRCESDVDREVEPRLRNSTHCSMFRLIFDALYRRECSV